MKKGKAGNSKLKKKGARTEAEVDAVKEPVVATELVQIREHTEMEDGEVSPMEKVVNQPDPDSGAPGVQEQAPQEDQVGKNDEKVTQQEQAAQQEQAKHQERMAQGSQDEQADKEELADKDQVDQKGNATMEVSIDPGLPVSQEDQAAQQKKAALQERLAQGNQLEQTNEKTPTEHVGQKEDGTQEVLTDPRLPTDQKEKAHQEVSTGPPLPVSLEDQAANQKKDAGQEQFAQGNQVVQADDEIQAEHAQEEESQLTTAASKKGSEEGSKKQTIKKGSEEGSKKQKQKKQVLDSAELGKEMEDSQSTTAASPPQQQGITVATVRPYFVKLAEKDRTKSNTSINRPCASGEFCRAPQKNVAQISHVCNVCTKPKHRTCGMEIPGLDARICQPCYKEQQSIQKESVTHGNKEVLTNEMQGNQEERANETQGNQEELADEETKEDQMGQKEDAQNEDATQEVLKDPHLTKTQKNQTDQKEQPPQQEETAQKEWVTQGSQEEQADNHAVQPERLAQGNQEEENDEEEEMDKEKEDKEDDASDEEDNASDEEDDASDKEEESDEESESEEEEEESNEEEQSDQEDHGGKVEQFAQGDQKAESNDRANEKIRRVKDGPSVQADDGVIDLLHSDSSSSEENTVQIKEGMGPRRVECGYVKVVEGIVYSVNRISDNEQEDISKQGSNNKKASNDKRGPDPEPATSPATAPAAAGAPVPAAAAAAAAVAAAVPTADAAAASPPSPARALFDSSFDSSPSLDGDGLKECSGTTGGEVGEGVPVDKCEMEKGNQNNDGVAWACSSEAEEDKEPILVGDVIYVPPGIHSTVPREYKVVGVLPAEMCPLRLDPHVFLSEILTITRKSTLSKNKKDQPTNRFKDIRDFRLIEQKTEQRDRPSLEIQSGQGRFSVESVGEIFRKNRKSLQRTLKKKKIPTDMLHKTKTKKKKRKRTKDKSPTMTESTSKDVPKDTTTSLAPTLESESKDVPKVTTTFLAPTLDDISFSCIASEDEDMDSANLIKKMMVNVSEEYKWIKYGVHVSAKPFGCKETFPAVIAGSPYRRSIQGHVGYCKDNCFCWNLFVHVKWDSNHQTDPVLCRDCFGEQPTRRVKKADVFTSFAVMCKVHPSHKDTLGPALSCVVNTVDLCCAKWNYKKPNQSDMFRSILEVNKKFSEIQVSSRFGSKNDCPDGFSFDGYIHIEALEQCLRTWFSDETLCVYEMSTWMDLREILESSSDQPSITIVYGIMNRECTSQQTDKTPEVNQSLQDESSMQEDIFLLKTDDPDDLDESHDKKFDNVMVIDDCCVEGEWCPPKYAVFCPMTVNGDYEICPVGVHWLDLDICIGESSDWSYLKRAVNVWKVKRTYRDIHVSTDSICKSVKVGRKVEVKVSLSKGYRFNEVFGTVANPTREIRFPESCQFEDSFRKGPACREFWEEVTQTAKTSFPCAYNMGEETHYISGNIFDRAHKNMLCEFSLHNNVTDDGTCGYESIVIAITSCPRFLARFAFGRKEKEPLPLTVDALKLQIGEYIARRLDGNERNFLLESWRDKMRIIDNAEVSYYAYNQLHQQLIALEEAKNEAEKEHAREWIVALIGDNDLWMDEGLVMVIEMIYRVKVLVVRNPKQPKATKKACQGIHRSNQLENVKNGPFNLFYPKCTIINAGIISLSSTIQTMITTMYSSATI